MRNFIRICLVSAFALAGAGCGDSTGSFEYPIVIAVALEDASGTPMLTIDADGPSTGGLVLARNSELPLRVRLLTASGPVEPTPQQSVEVAVTRSLAASWVGTWDGQGVLKAGPDAGTARLHVNVITRGAATFRSREILVEVI